MEQQKKKWYHKSGWIIFFLIFVFPFGLYLMWRYTKWYKIIKAVLSVVVVCWGILYIVFWAAFVEALIGEPTKQYHCGNYTYSVPVSWKEKKHSKKDDKTYDLENGEFEINVSEGSDFDMTKSNVKNRFVSLCNDIGLYDQKVTNYHNGQFKGFRVRFKGHLAGDNVSKKGTTDMYMLSYKTDNIDLYLTVRDRADNDYSYELENIVKSLKGNKKAGTKRDAGAELAKWLLGLS